MTTFEPGASVVLTHGLRWRPFSTAFLASMAAPIITDGLDVLVHEVIAAMATAPWSTSHVVPSIVMVAGLDGRPPAVRAALRPLVGGAEPLPPSWDGASEAGKDSATASSYPSSSPL